MAKMILNVIRRGGRVTFDETQTGNIRVIVSHPKVNNPGVFVGNERQVSAQVLDWLNNVNV